MRKRILLVDDCNDLAALYRAMFRNAPAIGIEVAETPEQALELLRTNAYDLVGLDIDLRHPTIDGVDLLLWVKARAPKLDVFMMSVRKGNGHC